MELLPLKINRFHARIESAHGAHDASAIMIEDNIVVQPSAIIRETTAGDVTVEQLEEWCFEFEVIANEPIDSHVADDVMEEAIWWAEAHGLGIGGGYKPVAEEANRTAISWAFQFGLCVQRDRTLIAYNTAASLWELIQAVCQRHGCQCVGGFRAFRDDD